MKIFINYATADLQPFRIPEIAARLEKSPDIERVFYWDRDSTVQKSIVQYMEDAITTCDVVLIVCSEASRQSGPVQQETDMAVYLNKRIVPMFRDINDVRVSLRPKRGVKFIPNDFEKFFDDLYLVLTERLPSTPDEQLIAEFHGIPLVIEEYRTMKALEDQIGKILPPIEPFCLPLAINQKKQGRYEFEIKKPQDKGTSSSPMGFSAKSHHVVQLDLAAIGPLQMFPEALGNLSFLEALDLQGQKISIIPELIGKLTHLEYLDLRGNNLNRIPDAIINLKSLKLLLIANNPLLRDDSHRRFLMDSMNLRIITQLLLNKCQLDRNLKKNSVLYNHRQDKCDDVICADCGYIISNQEQIDIMGGRDVVLRQVSKQIRSDSFQRTYYSFHMGCPKCGNKWLYSFGIIE